MAKIIIVQVSEPWPVPYLFTPRDSTIKMNCTALVGTRSPIWLIDIANDEVMLPLQFGNQDEELNAAGVFEIDTPETPTTVGLLINNTAGNNQTVINCNRLGTVATTTLFVFSRSLLMYCNSYTVNVLSIWNGMQVLVQFL